MSTIIILNHIHKDFPLIIAANRDEDYGRPSGPVQVLTNEPHIIIGGRDEVKGGTWLGVNKASLFAAITNQGVKDNTKETSRGQIVLDVLKCASLEEMITYVEGINPDLFNGFNLVFGNNERGYVAYSYILPSTMVISELPRGVNIVSSDMISNRPNDRKSFIHQKLAALPVDWLKAYKTLKKLLSNSDYEIKLKPKKRNGKLQGYCTKSSSILAFDGNGLARYKFHDRIVYKPRKDELEPWVPRYKDYVDLMRDGKATGGSYSEETPADDVEGAILDSKRILAEMKKIKERTSYFGKMGFFDRDK